MQYPSEDEAYAYYAKAVGDAVQNLATNPVQLVVARETRLLLDVDRDDSSASHEICGSLVHDGSGVQSKWITIKVNDTKYQKQTDSTGRFSIDIDLQPKSNNRTTYLITASFEGDTVKTASAQFTTQHGTEYAACTTTFYGFKPASNTTTITVEPQTSNVMTTTKTPEQLQQEAEDSGWLTTWHEFTWLYPWYRMHVCFNVSGAKIDVGFNPVLPGGITAETESLGNVIAPINPDPTIPLEKLKRIVQEMVESSIVDVLALAAITLAAGNSRFPPIIAIAWLHIVAV